MKKFKILAIVGSLRKDSYNKQLALATGEALGDRAEFTILDYADVPLFNEDHEFPAPEAVARVREVVKAADGIWFFTPEYNHSYPGVLKNLIDWLSRPISQTEHQVLAGKPVAFSGVGMGLSGTGIAQDILVALISFLDMRVMNQPRITIPSAYNLADASGKLDLSGSANYIAAQADAFLKFLEK